VRLNDRKLKEQEDNKKLAYLIDLKTVCVSKWNFFSKFETLEILKKIFYEMFFCKLYPISSILLLISVLVDLASGMVLANVSHDTKIDWLEVVQLQNYLF